jgi:hypothetical protein
MKTAHLILAVLICGCIGSMTYVCLDGSTASRPQECGAQPTTTTLPSKETTPDDVCAGFKTVSGDPDTQMARRCHIRQLLDSGYCMSLPDDGSAFDRTECIIELSGTAKDTILCQRLEGNAEIACEAYATEDLKKCAEIQVPDIMRRCDERINKAAMKRKEPQDCSNRSGEQKIWCVIYGAKKPQECLQIDERKYGDESVFCRARASDNATMCSKVGDVTMRNLCLRTVMGF